MRMLVQLSLRGVTGLAGGAAPVDGRVNVSMENMSRIRS